MVNSAYAYYSMDDMQNAKQTAQKILAIDKTNKEALDIIANIDKASIDEILNTAIGQYEKGDYSNALATVGKFLAKRQDDAYGLYYKALILDELKKPKEAGWIYRSLIQKHPDFINAYY